MANCSACGRDILPIVGHSCGDSFETVQVKKQLSQALQDMSKLKEYLLPIAKHHAGNYNQWRQMKENKNKPGYTEALDYIAALIRQ